MQLCRVPLLPATRVKRKVPNKGTGKPHRASFYKTQRQGRCCGNARGGREGETRGGGGGGS
jgi:hypothetical protein